MGGGLLPKAMGWPHKQIFEKEKRKKKTRGGGAHTSENAVIFSCVSFKERENILPRCVILARVRAQKPLSPTWSLGNSTKKGRMQLKTSAKR